MTRCNSCGQNNSGGSNFCRFCGSKFQQIQTPNAGNQRQAPPRPYSWQTDEFNVKETKSQTRPTQQIDRMQPNTNQLPDANQQLGQYQQNVGQQQLQPQYRNTMSAGYRCPHCNSNAMPQLVKKVSPTGWAVFTVLLITTLIFFWIGLLIQEETRVCPVCNMRVG